MTPKKLLETIDDNSVKLFLEEEFALCRLNRVKLLLSKDDTIDYNGTGCSGYFQDSPPTLALGIGKSIEEWLPVFIHETCHRDQWLEQDPTWGAGIKTYFDANEILDMWVHKAVELKDRQLRKVINQIVANELDCEKRSVAKIIKYQLPIDIEEYAQKANSYVWYYHAVAYTRKYSTKSAPYVNCKIWSKMPVDFDNDYSKIKRKILNLYLQHSW